MNFNNNITNNLQNAIEFSNGERERLGDNQIFPNHVVLGLMRLSDCSAMNILNKLGVNLSLLKTKLEDIKNISSTDANLASLHRTTESLLLLTNLEAKLSVLSGKAETNTSVKKSTLRNTFMWKCPECGKENADYVGTCGCGFEKDNTVPKIITHSSIEEKEKVNIEPVKRSGTWRCPQCGTENTYDEEVCWCGLRNPELNV